jgi:hypothetical protein
MSKRLRTWPALLALGLVLAGAIAAALALNGGNNQNTLSRADDRKVSDYQVDVSAFCSLEALDETEDLLGRDYGESYSALLDAVDGLIAIYRKDPQALYETGDKGEMLTMRQVLTDEASSLDRCDGDLARKLDRVLRE